MSVTNGGQVYSLGPNPQQPTPFVVGAVIGSDPMTATLQPPNPGGQGTVNIDGTSSKVDRRRLAASRRLRQFQVHQHAIYARLSRRSVQYPGNSGRGTLNVSNGGLVNLVSPTVDSDRTRRRLYLGRGGRPARSNQVGRRNDPNRQRLGQQPGWWNSATRDTQRIACSMTASVGGSGTIYDRSVRQSVTRAGSRGRRRKAGGECDWRASPIRQPTKRCFRTTV